MAGSMAQFQVTGAKELERKFRQMPAKLAKKGVRTAVRAGTKHIAAAVRGEARRQVGGSMGALIARQLKVRRPKKMRRGGYGLNAILMPDDKFIFYTKGSRSSLKTAKFVQGSGARYFIPFAIEFGHAAPYSTKAATGGYMKTHTGRGKRITGAKVVPPRPFFRDGWHSSKMAARHIVETELWRSVKDAAAKG